MWKYEQALDIAIIIVCIAIIIITALLMLNIIMEELDRDERK